MVFCIYGGVTGCNFKKKIVFLSLKTVFVLANSVDPDEMPHNAAFHLGLTVSQSTQLQLWKYQVGKTVVLVLTQI